MNDPDKPIDIGEKIIKGSDNDFTQGPLKKRGCTDILCLILFLVHWAGAIVVGIVSFKDGNPLRLISGKDYRGTYCGVPDDNNPLAKADYQYQMYTLNVNNIASNMATIVSEIQNNYNPDMIDKYFTKVCVNSCSTDNLGTSYTHPSSGISFNTLSTSVCPYSNDYCVFVPDLPLTLILDRFCSPVALNVDVSESNKALLPSNVVNSWSSWFGDVLTAWWVYLCCFGIAFAVSLVFLLLLRIGASCMVWTSIFLGLAVLGGAGAYVFMLSTRPEYEDDKLLYQVLAYVIWGFAGLYLLFILCSCKIIRRSIAIVKTAALFIHHNLSILLVPLFNWIFSIVLYVWFIAVTLFMFSTTDSSDSVQETPTGNATADQLYGEFTTNERYMFIYHFFSLLWNNAFIIGMSQLIIAGAVAIWYFSPVNADGKREVNGAICCFCCGAAVSRSTWNAFRYHMGSVAFGSFLLAVVQLVKWCLIYITAQVQNAEKNPQNACGSCIPCGIGSLFGKLNAANSCLVFVLKLLTYLVACFEKCVKFINKQAYIQVAVTGKNFFRSAKNGFFLCLRNARFLAVNGSIASLLKWVGLLFVTAGTGLIAFAILDSKKMSEKVSSPWLPTVVCCIIAWLTASLVLEVYSMATATTLQCYLADIEANAGVCSHTPEPLRDFVEADAKGKHKEENHNQNHGDNRSVAV